MVLSDDTRDHCQRRGAVRCRMERERPIGRWRRRETASPVFLHAASASRELHGGENYLGDEHRDQHGVEDYSPDEHGATMSLGSRRRNWQKPSGELSHRLRTASPLTSWSAAGKELADSDRRRHLRNRRRSARLHSRLQSKACRIGDFALRRGEPNRVINVPLALKETDRPHIRVRVTPVFGFRTLR